MSKYQSGIDPIEQLRSAYNNKSKKKTKIKQKANELYFDKDVRLNIRTDTAWLSTSTNKQYNLGSLWLFMEFHTKTIPDKATYFQKVSEAKV